MPYETLPLGASIDRIVAVSLTANQDGYGYWRATMAARRYGMPWRDGERQRFDVSSPEELLDAVCAQLGFWLEVD